VQDKWSYYIEERTDSELPETIHKNYFYQSQQTVPSDQSEQTRLLETMSLEIIFYLIRFCEKRGDVAIYEKSKVFLTFVAGVGDL